VTSNLAVLASEGKVVPRDCADKPVTVATVESKSEEQSGTVKVGTALTPSAHSVQHLYAS
jgi:hypothetical protein